MIVVAHLYVQRVSQSKLSGKISSHIGGGVSGLHADVRSTSRFGGKDEMSHDSNFEESNEDETAGLETVTLGTHEIDVFDELNE